MSLSNAALDAILAGYSSTWQAINLRVGATLVAQRAGRDGEMAVMLPHFPLLTQACEVWRSNTFPDLIAISEALKQLALPIADGFAVIDALCAEHRGTQPLPLTVRVFIRDTLQGMQAPVRALTASLDTLLAQITSFHAINDVIDDEIAAQLTGALAVLSSTAVLRLKAVGKRISAGLDAVCGVWSAMLAELHRIQSLPAKPMFVSGDLAGLQSADACDFWRRTLHEARAFSDGLREIDAEGYCDARAITRHIPAASLLAAPADSPFLLTEYVLLSCGFPMPHTVSH